MNRIARQLSCRHIKASTNHMETQLTIFLGVISKSVPNEHQGRAARIAVRNNKIVAYLTRYSLFDCCGVTTPTEWRRMANRDPLN